MASCSSSHHTGRPRLEGRPPSCPARTGVTGKRFVGTNTSGNCLGTKKDSKLKLNANARSVFRVDTRKHAGAFRYKDTRWGAWSAEMTPHEVKPKPKVLKASKEKWHNPAWADLGSKYSAPKQINTALGSVNAGRVEYTRVTVKNINRYPWLYEDEKKPHKTYDKPRWAAFAPGAGGPGRPPNASFGEDGQQRRPGMRATRRSSSARGGGRSPPGRSPPGQVYSEVMARGSRASHVERVHFIGD